MKKTVVSVAIALIIVGIAAVPTSAKEYEIVKGDTLWDISRTYETTVDDLMNLNNLTSDLIYPEQVLEIDREVDYIVKKGDTLSEIAHEYDVTVKNLKLWNNLTSDLIHIGQGLTIKESQTEEAVAATTTASTSSSKTDSQDMKILSMVATAYTAECEGCSGTTYTGINLLNDRDKKVIAVDPSVIPLGTRVHVEGYGEAIAGDIGGAIKGNRIDIHVPTKEIAFDWGVRTVDVTILD